MSDVRILIVEDLGVAADMAAQTLKQAGPYTVETAHAPGQAIEILAAGRFDVVVADMLFRPDSDEFETRRRRGLVTLDDDRLHLSGLAVLDAVSQRGVRTRPVLWSSGEANRRLHMIFAHEVLGCRVLCSKEAIADLPHAVASAISGQDYIHPVLEMYLTPGFAKPLRETLLASSSRLLVWRAMALGQHQHKMIAKTAGVQPNTIKKRMDEMRKVLLEFDPGCVADGSPSAELIRYASQNWEFFLDETVRARFP
ncbi:response regulator [Amycolatopsis nalaikhensis]|uniref:Response regulatory domain-containing protein n=1 Tax=Amycolatopsis nalaikhensis TaxID=715472 RepID=A0ABY8XQU7_9PSEU|nr:response regulator [Amycolatopsis sp. 2-2]WIV57976.1 hypothetical protein QP939_04680 [Amycolatopsis sp. 2-2]